MSLKEYQAKRDFEKTAEPKGGKTSGGGDTFVIQKHAASRLHYDFRLELDGVLLSWAVPKGPSLDPKQRRLAVRVEDHPVEYGGFEGIIPKGEYGGGTVMLWDRGRWEPVGDARAGLRKGHLKFLVLGEKIKGGYNLIRLEDEKNWLLVKEKDEFADTREVTDEDRSVATGRTMDEIAHEAQNVWHSKEVSLELDLGKRAPFPKEISPELCTLMEKPPEGDEWGHEIKHDGYRVVAYVEQGEVRLVTRGGQDYAARFPGIVQALRALPVQSAVVDGEVVMLDEQGRSSFQKLQNSGRTEEAVYMVFDLPYCQGRDLRGEPLRQRKETLRGLLGKDDHLRFSDHVVGQGADVFAQAGQLGCEGIVSKRLDSPYSGRRGKDWRKIKGSRTGEFVIVGYTDGARDGFGALLLAEPEGDELRFRGKTGTGFSQANIGKILASLEPVEHGPWKTSPIREKVHWVKPEQIAVIHYTEETDEGILRHPSFQKLKAATAPPPAVKVTNPGRVIDPSSGGTKGDLAAYYARVAERMLVHIADRPLTVVRCPDGLKGQCFFQKHLAKGLPKSVHGLEIDGEEFMYVNTPEGLLALVQMGAVEFHVWGSRRDELERPDRLVFDLDPDEDLEWARVVESCLAIRDRLRGIGLESFCKTTGGKGLHVVLPLQRRTDWDQVKAFAKTFADYMAAENPKRYTSVMSKARRTGRIFLDYLRNGRGATYVAAYSARSRPGLPISVPLDWEDVTPDLKPSSLTIASDSERIERGWSAWEKVGEVRQSLTKAVMGSQ